jgi:nucleotide-binding universal stress UspA family protein
MYEKILFCADFHPDSSFAFSTALDTAAQSGARLIVLHVLETCHRYSGVLITDNGDLCMSAAVLDKVKQKLKKFYLISSKKITPSQVDFRVSGGIPWMEILRVVRKEKVDLIVMGCSSMNGLMAADENAMPHLGKTGRAVATRAMCPITFVNSTKKFNYRKVLRHRNNDFVEAT